MHIKYPSIANPLKAKVQMWVALGPLLIIGSLVLGIFLNSMESQRLWQLGWGTSIAMGLLIMYLSSKEASSLISILEKEKLDLKQQIDSMQKQLVEAQSFAIQEKREASQKILTMTTDHEKEVSSLQTILQTHEHVEEQLINQLNETRVDRFQLTVLKESSEELNQDKEAQINNLKIEIEKLYNEVKLAKTKDAAPLGVELQFKQLQQQFQEKSQVLHQTRKELFSVEGRYSAYQKQYELEALDDNPLHVALIAQLKEIEQECKELEAEVDTLHELISKLLTQKRTTKKKKSSAIPL